jgi:uncharacterized membrane protein
VFGLIILIWAIFSKEFETMQLVIAGIYLFISFIQNSISSGMQLGMHAYYLELANKPERQPQSGLTSHTKCFMNEWMLILKRDIETAFLYCLFVVPGIIAYAKWSMADYSIVKDPDTSAMVAMTDAELDIEGYKSKFIWFKLSFAPLFIASACTGIGYFYVLAYWKMAKAKFYYYIKNPIVDKSDMDHLRTLEAEHFNFDDFVQEYESKVAQKQRQAQRRK